MELELLLTDIQFNISLIVTRGDQVNNENKRISLFGKKSGYTTECDFIDQFSKSQTKLTEVDH